MDHRVAFALVIGLVVLAGTLIDHRAKLARIRAERGTDEREMDRLRDLAGRLEQRMHNMERILDAEVPGWRERLD
ncbi:hypothetical protein [Eilatimonas milleporae]|uniref:Phage shock protein B n=1 Tax=Eilatimonas milleporae TaxID=911205 RepID=A0A3M0C2C4_9PROT|nr:hypothetical protein [Eilatimonas milleporae]RMB02807.1 phage shock protein B [Eilatimonas milleporae]